MSKPERHLRLIQGGKADEPVPEQQQPSGYEKLLAAANALHASAGGTLTITHSTGVMWVREGSGGL